MRFPILFALAAPIAAQIVSLPDPPPATTNTPLPFSAGIGRYQQWFSLAQAVQGFGPQPIRIDQIQVMAGTSAALATTLDLEISMAHAPGFGLSSLFDTNFASPRVVVLPRRIVNLTAGAPGAVVLTLAFTQLFTWDGARPVLVEARVFGNGRGNTSFNFDLQGTAQGLGSLMRVYQGGSASATSGVLSNGQGLFMRFRLRPGAITHFGSGCRGFNFITPTCEVASVPSPGMPWTHTIENAAAQQLCAFVLGDSRTEFITPSGVIPLPLDLTGLFNAPGCFLFTNPALLMFTTTLGGPGTATASIQLQVPPLTSFVGLSLYTQWVVNDPSALNGVMSATDAVWSIVAPVGG